MCVEGCVVLLRGAKLRCAVLVLKFRLRVMMSRAGIWVELGSEVGTCTHMASDGGRETGA